MKKMSLSSRFKLPVIICVLIFICCLSCTEDRTKNKKDNVSIIDKKSAGVSQLFLDYTDSVTKLPSAKLNEAGITSLNRAFSGKLPLAIYNGKQYNNDKNIVVQSYKNNDTKSIIKSGVILLVPKFITDSLRIRDFTRHFGNIKEEKQMIGTTEQPLPVQINVDANTAMKLTFNPGEKLELAHVIMVEVLKYK
ncbi:hypothetical protein [Pedobacter jeongneungensis]|uniref:hypothetical protein n=1 Tax=Pedobacter jeongneungensis TaxID=947309 RepID=UPI0004681F17|nr:hypothetical protein [Pedobacter jeongneungensis]